MSRRSKASRRLYFASLARVAWQHLNVARRALKRAKPHERPAAEARYASARIEWIAAGCPDNRGRIRDSRRPAEPVSVSEAGA